MQSKFNIIYDDSIEKHIMAKVYQKQIRLREVFKDYDPLRKGLVTEDKVHQHNLKFLMIKIVQVGIGDPRYPLTRKGHPKASCQVQIQSSGVVQLR